MALNSISFSLKFADPDFSLNQLHEAVGVKIFSYDLPYKIFINTVIYFFHICIFLAGTIQIKKNVSMNYSFCV